jgi:preprotein translocase subunit YajC
MEKNWLVIILIIVAVVAIAVFLIVRNQKDEKDLKEKIIGEDELPKKLKHDDEVDTEES